MPFEKRAVPRGIARKKGRKKTTRICEWFFRVGENLFFRAVTSQVSSAPASLTSVFGMGTGGPSRQSTPTILFCRLSQRLHNDTTPFRKLQALFSIFFKKIFRTGKEVETRPRKDCPPKLFPPGNWSDKTFGQPSRFSANGNTGKGRCRFSVVRNAGRRGDRFLKISGAAAPARDKKVARPQKNSRPIGRLLLVLAKTYFSGPSPAKYLRRRRA